MGESPRNGLERVVNAFQRILGGKTGAVEDPHGNIGKVPVIGHAVNAGGIAAIMAAVPLTAALSPPEKPLMMHKKFTAFSLPVKPGSFHSMQW